MGHRPIRISARTLTAVEAHLRAGYFLAPIARALKLQPHTLANRLRAEGRVSRRQLPDSLTPFQRTVWTRSLEGWSDWRIADAVGSTPGSVKVTRCVLRKKLGVPFERPALTQAQVRLLAARRSGLMPEQIAARGGVKPGSVRTMLWRASQREQRQESDR
jgi:DNA-binding NarL/FixJ family response regulator